MLDNASLIERFRSYRPAPSYPTYPPYHCGLYLEDHFYHHYRKLAEGKRRLYIPVFWTTCYIQHSTQGLQHLLSILPTDESYFTVSQHDDAIKESMPKDIIHFCAGGNNSNDKTCPIPLVCSPIPTYLIQEESRSILASFVGSNTHPIRDTMCNLYRHNSNFVISTQSWSPSVRNDDFKRYLDISLRSKFMLCPRGYGLNSFRLYESFQLGCVPVIVTDRPYLPWSDELDWSRFSVLVNENEIDKIQEVLSSISTPQYDELKAYGQSIYKTHFSLDGVCENILKRL